VQRGGREGEREGGERERERGGEPEIIGGGDISDDAVGKEC
jgi:hypothetical protein